MAQPAGVDASSATITMRVSDSREEREQSSPVHVIGGLPWRLVVSRLDDPEWHSATLHCDAAAEYELWRAEVVLKLRLVLPVFRSADVVKEYPREQLKFASWVRDGDRRGFFPAKIGPNATEVSVEIAVQREPVGFNRRPVIDLRSSILDVTLIVEGQRFPVNKRVLAAQSTYFNSLFYGFHMESRKNEVVLQNTNPEDFHELLKMMYGISTKPITVENVNRYLTMADMFDLKVVKDRMENFVLSTNRFSEQDKMALAINFKLETLKRTLLALAYFWCPPSDDHTYAMAAPQVP